MPNRKIESKIEASYEELGLTTTAMQRGWIIEGRNLLVRFQNLRVRRSFEIEARAKNDSDPFLGISGHEYIAYFFNRFDVSAGSRAQFPAEGFNMLVYCAWVSKILLVPDTLHQISSL